MDRKDPNFTAEILWCSHRIKTILETNIFANQNAKHPLVQSAFTELIICLNDLLQKSKKSGIPVTFTDSMDIKPKINDITDLVSVIRNAVCHVPSKTHERDGGAKFTFAIIHGQAALATFTDGTTANNDYADDVCYIFGDSKIYLNRHIIRAFYEAKTNLQRFTPYTL